MKSFKSGLAAALILASPIVALPLLSTSAFAAPAPIYTKDGNVALSGYDAVSFFAGGDPVKGLPSLTTTYKGATFQFANAANLAKFKAKPEAYAPQYGGYCAWAAAQGRTAPGSPQSAKVVNGKLYLNFNDSIQQKWVANQSEFIKQADEKWPAVIGTKG